MGLNLKIDIEGLSPFKRRLLFILPSLIIAALFLFNFLMPAYEEKGKLAAEVEKQESDIRLAQQQAAKLTALIAENERLKKRLFQLQAQLPEDKEVSALLRQVSELALKSGLDVVLWKPKERGVHPSKEVYEIPVDVEIRGSYHRFGQFFSSLTRLSRIVNLPAINMKPSEQKFQRKGMMVLHANFIAKTYSVISEEEKKKIEKMEKEKEEKK
jgi:type IV pilus assembly protein PilO